MSRRHFLQGAGAAAVWVPTSVKGYTAAEVRSFDSAGVMEQDISKWELDTPALCVDLDALEANLVTMQQTVSRNGIASRPHAKTHKCPAIARLQLESGSVGICTAKVSEAVSMYEHGIDRILMTTTNVTPFKITQAMNLRKWCTEFIQATDTPRNTRDLSEAAQAAGIVADVVVDIDSGGIVPASPRGSRPSNWPGWLTSYPGSGCEGCCATTEGRNM